VSRVDLRIEELVLDGVDPGDRIELARAVERELARLVAERGLPAALADAESLDAGRIAAGAGDVRGLGRALADAIHGGLSR